MPELPLLVTHGPLFFWGALAVASLLGVLAARALAGRRAARRAAASRDGMGSPSSALEALEAGSPAVISGILELEGGPREELRQEVLASSRSPAPARGPEVRRLRIGKVTVELLGEADILAGSAELWTAPDLQARSAWTFQPPLSLGPRERRLAGGDLVRVSGRLSVETAADRSGRGYRERERAYALLALPGGRLRLASEAAPRPSLGARARVTSALLGALAFTALGYGVGHLATEATRRASDTRAPSPLVDAQRALRFAQVGAATPFHRKPSLDALQHALLPDYRPELPVDPALVRLSASLERFREGGCQRTLLRLGDRRAPELLTELGEACDDARALRKAALHWMQEGELARASDLLLRAPAEKDPEIDFHGVPLDERVHLLAGRPGRASEAIRAHARLVPSLYKAGPGPDAIAATLACAADAIDARRGDGDARERLRAAAGRGGAKECALLHVDLLEGSERLAAIETFGDRTGWREEVELLALEADPARFPFGHGYFHVSFPARVFSGFRVDPRCDALEIAALERLASVTEPDPGVRWKRVELALDHAICASLWGLPGDASRWMKLVSGDARVLGTQGDATGKRRIYRSLDDLAVLAAYMELRAGKRGRDELARAPGGPAPRSASEWTSEWRPELEALAHYIAKGDAAKLAEPVEFPTFAKDRLGGRFSERVLRGLEIAARGSGEELAAWLEDKTDMVAFPVLFAGARHLETGREAVLAWLRRREARSTTCTLARYCSISELVIEQTNRKLVAEALGDQALAASHAARAEKLRRAWLRRDTALVLRVLERAPGAP